MATHIPVSDQQAKLISVVIKQLSGEYAKLAQVLSQHMKDKKLAGLRISGVHDLLKRIEETVPGYRELESTFAQPPRTVLYLMFREHLVLNGFDSDPVSSTGDPFRDEHLVFSLHGVPVVGTLEAIAESRGYSVSARSAGLANEQTVLLYQMIDAVNTAKPESPRNVAFVQAVKGRSVSTASAPAPTEEPIQTPTQAYKPVVTTAPTVITQTTTQVPTQTTAKPVSVDPVKTL